MPRRPTLTGRIDRRRNRNEVRSIRNRNRNVHFSPSIEHDVVGEIVCLKMDTLCRVCTGKIAKCTSLNTKVENSSSLSFLDFLNKCTSINARERDNLPQSLCSTCARSIKTFYSFVKLAEKSDIILREALENSTAIGRYNDNKEISCKETTITNCKIEEESEGFNKEDSFNCQTSKSSTGSSFYILELVKEEPRVSENTSIVYFKDAEITEREQFYSNIDHPQGIIENPDDILSCIDGQFASINAEHSDSEDDVPISSLKRRLVKNKETNSQKTKIKNENHIRIGHRYRNQVTSEAKEDSLKPHLCGHTENSYKCTECDIAFNDKEEFRTHCRNHVCGYKHDCNICGKKFAKLKYLRNHLPIHDEKRKYKCSICGKDFKHISGRWRHMRIHSGEMPFKCEICSKNFKAKYNLNRHMEGHSGITKKCGQCDKEFKYTKSLRRHIKWHTNPKPFKCENCEKLLASKPAYTRHMEICKPVGKSNEGTVTIQAFTRKKTKKLW